MDIQTFNDVVMGQIDTCTKTLISKADEYATEDRLHNFKVAAELQGTSTREALAGMMAKHTVSVYDLCRGELNPDMALWNEKLTDHINYLLLLRAVVKHEVSQLADSRPSQSQE